MGTSKGYGAPTTPQWTNLKRKVTHATHDGGLSVSEAGQLVSSFIGDLGGARLFARSGLSGVASYGDTTASSGRGRGGGSSTGGGGGRGSTAAISAGRSFGAFAGSVSSGNLDSALQEAGLGDLIGKSAKVVMRGLTDMLCGDGSTLDETDMRYAVLDLQKELLGDAHTYQETKEKLEAALQGSAFTQALHQLFGHYAFRQFQRVFHERLVQKHGLDKVRGMLGRVREFIRGKVGRLGNKRDVSRVNWQGPEGRRLTQSICEQTYRAFERVR